MTHFSFDMINPVVSVKLCLTLLHSVWQFAAIFALVYGVDLITRRWIGGRMRGAAVENSYLLHVAALCVGLAALPITYLMVDVDSAGLQSTSRHADGVATAAILPSTSDSIRLPSAAESTSALPGKTDLLDAHPAVSVAPDQPERAESPIAAVPRSAVSVAEFSEDSRGNWWLALAPWLLIGYAVGVAFMLLRLLRAIGASSRLARSAKRVTDSPLVATLKTLAARWSMRTVPLLAVAERTIVPQIVGLWRPVILLPASAVSGMTTDELELILIHEMAHLRRHDMWVHLLQRLAETILFFNPALWLLNRRICTLREYCCDDLTCGSPSDSGAKPPVEYAAALLKVVDICGAEQTTKTELATLAASGHSPSELRRRIARLFGEPLREPVGISRSGLLTICGAVLLLLGPALWPASGAQDETSASGKADLAQSSANDQKSPKAAATSVSQDADDGNQFEFSLKVVGPDGKPVPHAKVSLRTNPSVTKAQILRGKYEKDGRYGNHAIADDQGELSFALLKSPSRFNLAIETPGFAPYWAGWSPTVNGERIPNSFTAELDAGWVVGGIVVDQDGDPVKGVTVQPSVKFKKRPGDTSSLGVGTRIKTDAAGKWRYEYVPTSKPDVDVEVNHPSFQPHYQRLARDTFGLEGDAEPSGKIQLQRGLTVTGKVTDESGLPIEGALVRTKFINDLREAKTNKQGVYKLVGCDERMARIVVSAEGKATDLQTVRVDPDLEPVNFVMKPGGHVKIRVVDEDGKPIPKARIFYQRWRGGHAYWEFDHKHDYADENGVWEWNEAPLDEFTADICRPGGMQLSYQPLVSREKEYVFTPPPALVVHGTVIDARTKKPVPKFRATPGLRNKARRTKIDWDRGASYEAKDGRYRVTQTEDAIAHVVRIEADGYMVATSRDIRSDEGRIEVNFKLQPAKDIEATVQSVDGVPAAGAKIALGGAGSQISIRNGDIRDLSTFATRLVTDTNGHFSVPAREEPFQLVVTHASGFAHIKSPVDTIGKFVTLTPWARTEGTFRIGRTPMPNIRLEAFGAGPISYGDDVPNIFTSAEVVTGKDGRFVFPRMFPGQGRIGRSITLTVDDGATEVTSSVHQPATFVSGETTTLDLGGTGRSVIGKLAAAAGYKEKVLWNFATIYAEVDLQARQPAEAPADLRDDPVAHAAWWKAWKATEQGKAWLAEYQEYERIRSKSPDINATVDRDGSFRIDDVPVGRYRMFVRFSGAGNRDRKSPGSLHDFLLEVPAVKDGQAPDAVNLGTVQLQQQ